MVLGIPKTTNPGKDCRPTAAFGPPGRLGQASPRAPRSAGLRGNPWERQPQASQEVQEPPQIGGSGDSWHHRFLGPLMAIRMKDDCFARGFIDAIHTRKLRKFDYKRTGKTKLNQSTQCWKSGATQKAIRINLMHVLLPTRLSFSYGICLQVLHLSPCILS